MTQIRARVVNHKLRQRPGDVHFCRELLDATRRCFQRQRSGLAQNVNDRHDLGSWGRRRSALRRSAPAGRGAGHDLLLRHHRYRQAGLWDDRFALPHHPVRGQPGGARRHGAHQLRYLQRRRHRKHERGSQPITFRANGTGVVINGSGRERDAFFITRANYIIVDGLTIQNATRAGMRIDNSHHVTVRNCTLRCMATTSNSH